MKKILNFLLVALILPFGISAQEVIIDNFAGWAKVTSFTDNGGGNYTIVLNSFGGNQSANGNTYAIADLVVTASPTVRYVLHSDCSHFKVTARTGLTLTLSDLDLGNSVLPSAGQTIGLSREVLRNGFWKGNSPQFGDGNGGAINGVVNSLGACINTHYNEIQVKRDSVAATLSSITTGDSTNISVVKTGANIVKSNLITVNGGNKATDSLMLFNANTKQIKLLNSADIAFNSDSLITPTYITKTQAKNAYIGGVAKDFSITTDGSGNRILVENITNADASTFTPLNNKVLKVFNPVTGTVQQVTQDSLLKPAVEINKITALNQLDVTQKVGYEAVLITATDTTILKKVDATKWQVDVTRRSTSPPLDTVVSGNAITYRNAIWKNNNIITGKSIDFVPQNDGSWKKVGKWTNTDFGIRADGVDRTTEFQAMLTIFQQKGIKAEIEIDSGVRFNSCLLTSTPKHCRIAYYAQSDLCRPTIYAYQVTTEQKLYINGGNESGAVTEFVVEGNVNPAMVVNAKPSWGGNSANLTGTQTPRSPARASLGMAIDNVFMNYQKIERADTAASRGGISIDGYSNEVHVNIFTLKGIGSANLSGVLVGDRVKGEISGCIGLVRNVFADSLILYWKFGQPNLGGEKFRITNTGTVSTTNYTTWDNRQELANSAISLDEDKGSVNIWALPYNNNTHRFNVGKGMLIAAEYDGNRTGMFSGSGLLDRYIGLRPYQSLAASGKYIYWNSLSDNLEIRDKDAIDKLAVFANNKNFLVGDSTTSANFAGARVIQLGKNTDNIAIFGTKTQWGDWGWVNYANVFYTQRNNATKYPLVVGNIGIRVGGNSILTPTYALEVDAITGGTGNPLYLQGLNAGATTDSILTSASGVVRRMSLTDLTVATVIKSSNAVVVIPTISGMGTVGTVNVTVTGAVVGMQVAASPRTNTMSLGVSAPIVYVSAPNTVTFAFTGTTVSTTNGNASTNWDITIIK